MAGKRIYDREHCTKVICEHLEAGDGNSLRSACRLEGMPDPATFLRWCDDDPDVAQRYARAMTTGLELDAQEIIELSRRACANKIDIAQLRIEIDTRKWVFARRLPQWADKQHVEHKGETSVTIITGVPTRSKLDEMLE